MQYKDPYIELCVEGSSSIFKGLSEKDKEALDQHHSVSIYSKGEIIIREGSKQRGLVCLASGKAKVFKVGAGGREQILKMLRPQGFIGYRSLFSDNPFPFTVTAVEDTSVVVFEKIYLMRVLRRNADLAIKFIKLMADELLYLNNRIVSLTQKHVSARIAESLLLLRDTYGLEADGRTIRVMLSREDIAHLSNMTTSNAIRTLSDMVSEKLIEIEGRRIMILGPTMLENISELG
jgi:CRP-like cAMP-binding protein